MTRRLSIYTSKQYHPSVRRRWQSLKACIKICNRYSLLLYSLTATCLHQGFWPTVARARHQFRASLIQHVLKQDVGQLLLPSTQLHQGVTVRKTYNRGYTDSQWTQLELPLDGSEWPNLVSVNVSSELVHQRIILVREWNKLPTHAYLRHKDKPLEKSCDLSRMFNLPVDIIYYILSWVDPSTRE